MEKTDILIGMAETAQILGVSRQAVQSLHKQSLRPNYRGDFPRADYMRPDGSRPLWWRSKIEAYAERRKRGDARVMPRERTIAVKIGPDGTVSAVTPGVQEDGILVIEHVPTHLPDAEVIDVFRRALLLGINAGTDRVDYRNLVRNLANREKP